MTELPVGPAPPPVSLYVHFPFCEHRCHYCDFSVHRTRTPPVSEWLDCIGRELEQWLDRSGWTVPLPVETLFVGGGTPSLMGSRMVELGSILADKAGLDASRVEWTAESNPASIDLDLIQAWRAAGVNRLSVGVQSFDDGVLRWLGRLHDVEGARRALATARAGDFDSLNADLIFGLPVSVERRWGKEVEMAMAAGVTHVSAYGLTAEPRTPLGRRVRAGEAVMPTGERYAAEYAEAADALTSAGFLHYEVSNFALPGHECLHNWHYWDGSPYLGLGPSAHGFVGETRVWNVFRWEAYRGVLAGGGSPIEGHETLGAGESRLERLWLALRTNRGIAAGDPLAEDLEASAAGLLASWREAGWVAADEERIRLTEAGWLRMDELVAALDAKVPETGGG